MKQRGDANYFFVRGSIFCLYIVISVYLSLRVRNCMYHCVDKHRLAQVIAECFVGMTIPISAFHAWEHLTNFVRPRLQSQIVRIIWMVPIYSFESLLSIMYMEYAVYFQAMREIYEAYVIYCFMRFLLQFMGDGRNLADRLASMPASMGYHKPPFCCLEPWQMGADFLRRCKAGVFQYVVVRFLLAVLTLFLSIIGCYEEGNYEYTSAYLWITGICCCSQSWALYSLFMFYHCSHKELITMRPFMKFLCLKMVIFFCWWQALAISMLVRLGHINSAHGHSVQEVADLIQDLLISMEMLVAAIAFLNSFPITEFAVVRQLNWGKGTQTALSLSTATISSDATGTLMYSEGMTNCVVNNSPNSEVGGFLPPGGGGGGGLFVETVACIAGSIIGNSNIINQRTIQSIPHPSLPVDKVPLITSDSSLDSFAPSPISDNEKSPATFSSRKVFLPYAIPMSKMDLTEKKIKKNKKDKIDINYNTEYFGEKDLHEDKIEVKEKDKSDFKSEKLLGLNFSSPLTVLRSAGYYPFSFQSLLPAFSFSFTKNSINKNRNDNKKINGKYNTLVSEGTGNASLKALSENNKKMNKVNIISKEGGSFHQKYNGKGVEMDDDVEASLLHQNSNLISDDSLIKETNYIVNQHNDDINLVKYNSRNGYGNGNGIGCSGSGSGGFVSIALTGCGPESTGRCNSPPFLPSPAARRKNNSTNKFSNDTNLVNAKMNMNSDASSDNSDGNDDIDNNSITNDKKFPRDGMAKCIPTSVSVSVSANYLSKETKRNISSTGYRSSPSISLPSSPCPHTLSPPPCTSTPIERDFLTFIPPNSGIIKSRNSAESFHRMNHSTMINKLLDKGSDESVSKKIDKNYQNLLPSFGAEYSHPSSTLFHGNKNRYLSSTSPAGNPSLNQTNINQNNSNNFNNLSNLNGLKRDLYPESEHQHQHNVVRDRSHSFDHELYPITTPATNYRMQSNNYNIESSKDYTADSLRGDDVNYFQQFKEKDHFLGTKGVFGGNDNFNSGSGSGSGGIGSSLMLCQQSPLQALVTCTVPRELQEDLQELGAFIVDSYVHAPCIIIRKWVKGTAARS